MTAAIPIIAATWLAVLVCTWITAGEKHRRRWPWTAWAAFAWFVPLVVLELLPEGED